MILCVAYKSLLDANNDARVSDTSAQGSLELRERSGATFGITIIAVSVHGTANSAQAHVDAYGAAESSEPNANCEVAISSPVLGLKEVNVTPSQPAPKGGAAISRKATTANGDVTRLERYAWARGNVSVVLVMSADAAIVSDFDVEAATKATNAAIDSAAQAK